MRKAGNWVHCTLGDVLRLRTERGVAGDPLLSVLSDRGVVPQAESGRRDISSTDKTTYRRVYPGDIVYNTMRMWQGVSARSEHHGIVSPAYTVCLPSRGANTRFLRHLLRHPRLVAEFKNRSQGLVSDTWNLKFSSFAKIPICMPPEVEQRRIADILDSVDESIRSTERLIVKLERRREGILQQLVEQVDAVHEPRFSTVEQEFDVRPGITLGVHRRPRGRATPYLRVANVQRGGVDFSDLAFMETSKDDLATYALRAGDLLIVEGHASPWEIGRCAAICQDPGTLVYQNHLFRLRPKRLRFEYAQLWLNSGQTRSYWRRMCATSSGLYTINSRQLRALPVRVPEPEEQDRVVELVRSHDEMVDFERVRLEKLRKLKQGLMEDLLMGRVRVPVEGRST